MLHAAYFKQERSLKRTSKQMTVLCKTYLNKVIIKNNVSEACS